MAARGRHRRYQPSSINRASLTVTAGGAGIVLPLVAGTAADAATVDTWNKVAACESSGNWHVNTGNGYFGGLQFTSSTWREYGGTVYARRADLATKGQQIAIAEKVLEGQGPGAWPVCGPEAGLHRGGPAPDTDPGGGQRTQTRRTQPVQETKARPAATDRGAQRTAAGHAVAGPGSPYTVAPGDSLSAIAQDHRVAGGWQALYATNQRVIGDDPNLIYPGQRLSLRVTDRPRHTAPRPDAKPPRVAKPAPARPGGTKPAATKPAHRTHAGGFVLPVSASIGTQYRTSGSHWASGYHTGVDFLVPTGTSVKAVGSGTVVSAGWAGAYGYEIVIRHADGRYSQYAHLSALSVRAGQSVNAGQRIGRSGTTGNSTGPHLHFEIRTGSGYGTDIDPLAYLRGHGVSV
ncbi:transglycosylase family protein [Streptomyces sp. NRRL S-87]|uniref:transglycosylase family protein n=1 Tax=Streptomyces sp. NRRL S-87 TaxID=1463920 RepID=UPI0004BE4A90|nr:transglycosylase family protein [Streptomyces sp. NRRL S-87]